jgi:Tol biopolymer transport system component
MDSRRWEEVQASFDQLVQLDIVERGNRLRALGSTDPELRAAIESLLAADSEADARLSPLEAAFLLDSARVSDPLSLVGRTIAHFRVHEPIGGGGMGVVYRAQDVRLGRPVALKFLLPHYNLDAAAKARFLREAHAAAALDHPHLCTIYDVGESDDGRLFLAMALYPGETIRARFARDGPLPVGAALAITRQIAHGLGCAHAAGIVHRDLKPGNVILLPDGTVKILDFGLAKVRDQTTSEAGTRFGTVAYMAPEQIRGQTVDARADLWAVGVVLYEMLTGQKPFAGEHEVAIAHAILHDEPVPPSRLRDGLPAAVEEIVLALLQKDPTGRYAAVDELMADLAAVGTVGEPAVRAAPTSWLRTRHTRFAKSVWMVTLGAVVVVGVVGYAASNTGPDGATWLRSRAPGPVSRYAIALPDTQALDISGGLHFRIAISPGGERLVYVGTSSDGNHRLWVRRRDQLYATPLAGTEGAVHPFFSPDGSRVGFVSEGTPPAIKVVSLAGGPPTTVTDSVVDGGGAWGHDGYIYFDAHLEGDGIARVAENGGAPEPVTRTDYAKGEGWHFQPEPLPNGKGVLFVISRGGGVIESDVAVLDLKSGVHRVLVRGVSPRYARSGHLLYVTADGVLKAAPFDQDKLVLTGEPVVVVGGVGSVRGFGMHDLTVSATGTFVYTVAPAPVSELTWVTRDGRATPIDSAWRAVFTSLALSPDGSALAVGVREGIHNHVWVKPLDRGPASKLTFDGGYSDRPSWTPDGRSVAFVRAVSPSWNLYVGPVDGSALPRVLRDETGYLNEVEFSRDGQWLVYREGFDLYAARTDGATARTPLVVTPAGDLTPRLSPDGRWLAYSTYEESGWREVFVAPFPNTGSARWQISRGGGAEPVWSRSGRELFYRNGRMELVAATVLPGATFAIGEQRVLFPTAQYVAYPAWRTYDVSPDGTRFVMIRPIAQPRDELIWVENFFEELRAKVKRQP